MKYIVVSAVNLVEGGTLMILKNLLEYLDKWILDRQGDYKVLILTYSKTLCYHSNPNFVYVEFKWPKKNWILRLYCEYIYFYFYSKKIKPYIWFSVHDITPNVYAEKKIVYCHNPTPFYHPRFCDIKYSCKVFLFSLFYKYLYRINIHKNTFIIVQQEWIRNEFMKMYSIDSRKIIVAYPVSKKAPKKLSLESNTDRTVFFYPSLSRPFKNFEVIGAAVEILRKKNIFDYEVILTIDGTENNYANWIYNRFGYLDNLKFIGKMSYDDVAEFYEKTTCLIFPSKLETWGLPISEFSAYNKPMLIADLPYAKETASFSQYVSFFDPFNPVELSNKMQSIINGNREFLNKCTMKKIQYPFAQSWEDVFKIIL